ncbi:hypothetical protein SUGI_0692330 [Cryptomeria japonica]|uniref:zinc finger protein ZAT9-like n=1 Tax=Cryptomeria japonica TaxID=3369 RepID=UPI002414CDB4|nr:zinc finger protein ZAT9-like [Cryptomeria japonica]GLJ34432.1 hypothetical protein SUGI_0692330 [Cryptomeria japonica]
MAFSTGAQPPQQQFFSSTVGFMARRNRSKRFRPYFSEREAQEEKDHQQLAAYSLMMISHAHGMTSPLPILSFLSKRKSQRLLEGFNFEADSPKMLRLKEESEKRYNCKGCRKKKFMSLQALGGQRESLYNMSKKFYDNKNVASSSAKEKLHICPICDRGFRSGRSLGGHKRAHRRYIYIDAMSPPQALF